MLSLMKSRKSCENVIEEGCELSIVNWGRLGEAVSSDSSRVPPLNIGKLFSSECGEAPLVGGS